MRVEATVQFIGQATLDDADITQALVESVTDGTNIIVW